MQTLEHITQTQLASGLLRLSPDKGYTLFDRKSHRTFPTADIYPDDLPNWSAVAVDAAVEEEPVENDVKPKKSKKK